MASDYVTQNIKHTPPLCSRHDVFLSISLHCWKRWETHEKGVNRLLWLLITSHKNIKHAPPRPSVADTMFSCQFLYIVEKGVFLSISLHHRKRWETHEKGVNRLSWLLITSHKNIKHTLPLCSRHDVFLLISLHCRKSWETHEKVSIDCHGFWLRHTKT